MSTWSGTTRRNAHCTSRVSHICTSSATTYLADHNCVQRDGFFTSKMRSRASQGSGAGRDNSTHKEQHDGPCHCCRPNCWFIGDVALTKVLKRNTFVGRHRQQGQLCHNSSCSQHSLVPMSPSCSVGGAAAAAPALPFAVQVLRTTNESAAISAAWANTHELTGDKIHKASGVCFVL